MSIGWIRIHRRIVDSDIYQMPPLYLRVFERLLIEANHQDNEIPYKASGEKTIGKKLIKRGERLTSVRGICRWIMWYERGKEIIPNPKTIQNILDWLVENGMIEIYGVKGNRTETHYKIVNYNDYQKKDDEEVTEKKQKRNRKETEKKQSTDTNKNDKECLKNVKNDKDTIPSKKECRVFNDNDKEYLLAKYLSNQISKRLDRPQQTEKILQNWSADFEKMVRLDKIDIEDIKNVLMFSQQDDFWQSNILSASKFRKQYLTLLSKMKKGNSGSNKKQGGLGNLLEMIEGGTFDE